MKAWPFEVRATLERGDPKLLLDFCAMLGTLNRGDIGA
jgi:hypothetical protein